MNSDNPPTPKPSNTPTLCLPGCRHDILGHYLKAIGLLRVLAKCADAEHRDTNAEGWWDTDSACFCLRSPKYDTREKLVEFFEKHYQPTPFFSPWNTGGGMEEKKQITFSIAQGAWKNFWADNHDAILPLLVDQADLTEDVQLGDKPLKLTLSAPLTKWKSHSDIAVVIGQTKGKRPRPVVEFWWSETALIAFFDALKAQRPALERIIKFTKAVKKKFVPGRPSLTFDVHNEEALKELSDSKVFCLQVKVKESGKKAVIAKLAKLPANSPDLNTALSRGREFFPRFQQEDANQQHLLEELRDGNPAASAEALDAVFTTRVTERPQDSPLFLNRGDAGNSEIFRQFWVSFFEMRAEPAVSVAHGLFAEPSARAPLTDGKGSPFFPDAIKAYNIGSGWVTENFPFNALDYILAVEGAFAMRGSVGRTLAANSRRFAAFPFVFDTGEDMVDDGNKVKGTASSLWFPLWDRPVTFAELSSFITDAQARLPGKEARFSAEFMRALHSQGVDAGFTGWQEFRFKMKASRVPWVSTGTYVESSFREDATRLNSALHPLDEAGFLEQFAWDPARRSKRSPHRSLEELNAAMETATRETTPHNCLDLLSAIFRASRQMAVSRSFRDTLPGKTPRFFRPLPMDDWRHLLSGLETQPEFRIARAVASMVGRMKQPDGTFSEALPMLGSILPLTLGTDSVWYLPDPPSRQAVWSGTDLCHDLAAVLARRYLVSLNDERPALVSAFGAPLTDVLAFLHGDLDDHQIARWIEVLSLIDWRLVKTNVTPTQASEAEAPAIPIEYAALRTLLDLECERRDAGDKTKRRSQRPIALLCQRSASTLPQAVTEALRWIAIWGFANPWGEEAKARKPRLTGRDIVGLRAISPGVDPRRLAAAVCIPLHWRDRETLYRAVSLPQIN